MSSLTFWTMRRHVRSFFLRPPVERLLLIKAWCVVAGVRVALSLLPFPRFQALFGRMRAAIGVRRDTEPLPSIAQLVWAVQWASLYVPHPTCLTQALAAQMLLERCGYPTRLVIGVAPHEKGEGPFQAHAWLESKGVVVIGESAVNYVPLTTLQATTPHG
jgi:hypothetical protein